MTVILRITYSSTEC